MSTKREEVRDFVKRKTREAIAMHVAEMTDRVVAETIRGSMNSIASAVCWHINEEYCFIELADIMEWKRTRSRR